MECLEESDWMMECVSSFRPASTIKPGTWMMLDVGCAMCLRLEESVKTRFFELVGKFYDSNDVTDA
jgi:hypothetical protein